MFKLKNTWLSLTIWITLCTACNQPLKEEKSQASNTNIPALIVEKLNSPVEQSIRGCSIGKDNSIWLSGAKGTVLTSTDEGKNWMVIPAPDNDSLDYRSIWAFDQNHAFIASAGFPSRVYRTIDGGKQWTLVKENKDSSSFMNSIAFRSEKEGIIFGDQINGVHFILFTLDSGKNWQRVPSESLTLALANENGFAASGSCIAINEKGHYYIGLGGEKIRVLFSTDGQQWNAENTTLSDTIDYFGIYSLAFGKDRLIGVGGSFLAEDYFYHPTILQSSDKTWRKSQGKIFGYRSIIDYCSTNDLWLSAGTNGIDVSTDGGEHWVVKSNQSLNTLRFFEDQSVAIGANSKGEIFRIRLDYTN